MPLQLRAANEFYRTIIGPVVGAECSELSASRLWTRGLQVADLNQFRGIEVIPRKVAIFLAIKRKRYRLRTG